MTSFLRRVAALAKLRVISLLVVTGAAGAWKEAGGVPDGVVLLTVIAAGALAAAGANAVNQGLDADMDAVMRRTRTRPVPSEQMSARGAVVTGAVLIALACALMLAGANALAAALTLAAAAVYVFVYTMLLKRRSWNNIVIGGAAGAFPPLIGSAAVAGEITPAGLYMFAFVFFWTPPHFWALSLLLREDYAAAKTPMLGVVASVRDTAAQILLYVALLTAMAWLPLAAGYGGWTFAVATTLLGANWLRLAWPLLHGASAKQTRAAYKYSLLYLALAFLALAAEPSLPWRG